MDLPISSLRRRTLSSRLSEEAIRQFINAKTHDEYSSVSLERSS